MNEVDRRRAAFVELHREGCFVIPNPWDVGSARYLKHLGFEALATTSGGFHFSLGEPDIEGRVTRDALLAHTAAIVDATDLPVNADFQSGYGATPEAVAESVTLCVATGVAGLSIEDATGRDDQPLYDLPVALERLAAARRAIDRSGAKVLLTARAESYLVGHPEPLKDVLRRLTAYADAGADVLYAPGPRTPEDFRAIVGAVAPKPVNALIGGDIGLAVHDLAELGIRRISVGSALARAAWGGFMRAATAIAENGSFAGFDGAAPYKKLNAIFGG